jgi:hypothetical protein
LLGDQRPAHRGLLDRARGGIGDGADVSGKRLGIAFVKALGALAQGLDHAARQGYAGLLGDGFANPVRRLDSEVWQGILSQ